MDEIYHNLARADIWRLAAPTGETAFEATEVWMQHETGKIETRISRVDSQSETESPSVKSLKDWLAEDSDGGISHSSESLLVRLVWMTARRQDRRIKLCQDTQNTLVDRFGLGHAYKYFRSSLTGITSLPVVQDDDANKHPYVFAYAPKLVVLWSYTHFPAGAGRRPLIQGIILIEEGKKKSLHKFLHSTLWTADLYHSPMFPYLMLAMWLGVQISSTHAEVVHGVEVVEGSTGYHDYATLPPPPKNLESTGRLAVVASGYKGRLASTDRKIAVMEKLLQFMSRILEKEEGSQSESSSLVNLSCRRGNGLLRNHVDVLRERAEMHRLDAECAHKRVQIQIDALYSIIAQNDSITAQKVSLSSLNQATATHNLAYSTYRDSSSMKTLAIVTMFFLPGSFVSALFSMPMFEWDKAAESPSSGIGVGLMPQFNLYWAITVPLTAVTFCLYFLWLWFLKRELRVKFKEAPIKDLPDFSEKGTSEANRCSQSAWNLATQWGITEGNIFDTPPYTNLTPYPHARVYALVQRQRRRPFSQLCALSRLSQNLRRPSSKLLPRNAHSQGAMAAPAPGSVVPAQLGFLAIFNPSLGNTDDTIDDQIVYYASATSNSSSGKRRRTRSRPTEGISQEERNEQLRQIGLAQGMIHFGRDFADGEAVDSIDTERARVVIHELEPGWWILASIDLNKVPLPPRLLTNASESQSEMYDYNSKEMKPAALILRDLLRAHRIFLMHHDASLSSLFLRTNRLKVVAMLNRYWDLFLSTWNVMMHGNPARDVYGGINIAASGELGVGVGEEERGSGEREVLEGLVGRVEGLVDLVVSKFGEADDGEADHVSSTAPWLGSGRQPAAGDGAIFLGTGAISRKSLRDITHWMDDLYTWGDHAYGVIESPISTRRARARRSSKKTDEAAPMAKTKASADDAPTPTVAAETPQKPDTEDSSANTNDKGKQTDLPKDSKAANTSKDAEDGKLDKMVSYLKLGYGDYWTIPGVPTSFGAGGQPSTQQAAPAQKPKAATPEKRPKLPAKSPSQEAEGHYLIGLKGEIEEAHSGDHDGSGDSDDSSPELDSRTVLRTLHVEMTQGDEDVTEELPVTDDLTMKQIEGALRPGGNPQLQSRTERLRVVVYVNKPFIFVFLFQLRTDSLAWDALYRSLHYQLSPLRKPLLSSTQYRPERPRTGSGAGTSASSPGIHDLVWNPLDLSVHSTIPNIPDSIYGDPAAERHWSRADAVSTHLHMLNVFAATRSAANSDLERTQKTSRGWWVVWTRLVERSPPQRQPSGSARDSPATTAPPSPTAASVEQQQQQQDPPVTSKEIILIRRASDHAGAGGAAGSGPETVGRLAHGIGVDTRRYVEDLLNML